MLLRPMTVEDDDFEPPTMRPAHGRAPLHESARLEQWVRERLRTQALAVASPATPETRAPRTLSGSELAGHWGVQASGSLPFKSALWEVLLLTLVVAHVVVCLLSVGFSC